MQKLPTASIVLALPLAAAAPAFTGGEERAQAIPDPPPAVMGNAQTLLGHYARWREAVPERNSVVAVELGWSKGRSIRATRATGAVLFDLQTNEWSVSLDGSDLGVDTELWMSTLRGDDAAWRRLGALSVEGGAANAAGVEDGAWHLGLGEAGVAGACVDGFAITEQGVHPNEGLLLYGSPGLFERLGAQGATPTGPQVDLPMAETLVALGEDLFFNETFGGNGRTCGTCHPAANNLTIDPAFIATLPQSDPLFLAETDPALDSTQNGGRVFENPALMRRMGLIVENLDGFDDLQNRFVMRSVPHLFGLARTTALLPNQRGDNVELTGWSGDGAPGSGSLREFSTGAVRQHMTRTLDRVEGVDFRLPTSLELTALEAFMLSLGRPEEVDLFSMGFRDPAMVRGLNAFLFEGACNFCHQNGGSNGFFSGGHGNFNVNTGVETMTQSLPLFANERRPVDGGRGTNPSGTRVSLIANPDGSFGDRSFNSVSLVEMADTPPWFHSNVTADPDSGLANTVEGAVAFYNSDAFAAEFGAGFIDMSAGSIADIGAMLRGVNAVENIRAATDYANRSLAALLLPAPKVIHAARLARQAIEETGDARRVLREVALLPSITPNFDAAILQLRASTAGPLADRRAQLQEALLRLAAARAGIVD